jgi:hypothetical protein
MDKKKKDTEKSRHVELAAVAAVKAELHKRYNFELKKGYEIYMTESNAPCKDLHCTSPEGTEFGIQVKGASDAKTGVFIQGSFFKRNGKNLFLIAVETPLNQPSEPFRFFILSLEDAIVEHNKLYADRMDKDGRLLTKKGRPLSLNSDGTVKGDGLIWESIKNYEKKWDKLPK